VVTRLLVPPQPDAVVAPPPREIVLPQSRGLAQMAVGVHDIGISRHGVSLLPRLLRRQPRSRVPPVPTLWHDGPIVAQAAIADRNVEMVEELRVEVSQSVRAWAVVVRGELDMQTAAQLERVLEDVIRE